MKIFGKEIDDTCKDCGRILDCELFRCGHAIGQESRSRIAEMLKCQMSQPFYKPKERKDW